MHICSISRTTVSAANYGIMSSSSVTLMKKVTDTTQKWIKSNQARTDEQHQSDRASQDKHHARKTEGKDRWGSFKEPILEWQNGLCWLPCHLRNHWGKWVISRTFLSKIKKIEKSSKKVKNFFLRCRHLQRSFCVRLARTRAHATSNF